MIFLSLQVKGIPAKISDFGLRGMLRVVFKPLVSSWLTKFSYYAICLFSGEPDTIGRWDPSLLLEGSLETNMLKCELKFKAPEIDYELGGVGDVLNLPGLHKIVEQIIAEQVRTESFIENQNLAIQP